MSIHYVITGPTNLSGDVPIGDAQSVEFVVGGLLAGSGYKIALSALDSKGDDCSGVSDSFTIYASETTYVGVTLACVVVSDATTIGDVSTGSLFVDASVVLVDGGGGVFCPGISSFSILPADVPVGSTMALSLATVGGGPASVAWSAESGAGLSGGGVFADPTAPNTTFLCSSPGSLQIVATVALPSTSACSGVTFTRMAAQVNCDP
jgi:hypothetical protein